MACIFLSLPSRQFGNLPIKFPVTQSLLLVVLACSHLSLFTPARASEQAQKRVLVFYTARKDALAPVIAERALQKTLNEGLSDHLDYYSEYIDMARFPDPRYQSALHDFLRRKYEGQRFDLIVTVGGTALEFIERNGAELYPKTPVVFLAGGNRKIEDLRMKPNYTGVMDRLDLKATLDLALKIQPNTKHVFVISGASSNDKFYENLFRRQSRELEGRLTFNYLSESSLVEMQKTVANLPRDSFIYYLSVTEDSAGNKFFPQDTIQKIASVANAPIYIWIDSAMRPEILGGSMMDLETMAEQAAGLALRVLRGEKPENIAIIEANTYVNMFSWPQLQRWGISEDKLPPGSVVRYKEKSFWEEYKWYIISAIALIVVQSLLIIGLLIHRAWRRRAEQERDERLRFQTLLSELSAAFVNLPIGEVDGEIEKWMQRLIEFFGSDRSAIMEFSADGTSLSFTHSYAAPEFQSFDRQISTDLFHWYEGQLRDGKTIVLSQLPDDLPKEAKAEREFFHRIGSKSHLAVPLSIGGSSIGALTFNSLGSHRVWTDEFVQRNNLIGEIFANAIARKRSEESLKSSLSEIEQLKEQLQAENVYLHEEIKLAHNFSEIVGGSDALKYMLFKVELVAPTDTAVLLLGETGTGKELAAHAIHDHSTRKDRPLVKVNCAALPSTLIESELFGHEKGAFTGAQARKVGRFELANGGTLFLDEIGEMPLDLQSRLLRVLQEGEFERLGSSQTIKVDVRVIAATNRDLKTEVESGHFREDLWYRLNVYPITLPSLRQRKEDIPLLVSFFADKFSKKIGRSIKSVAPATMKELQNYSWPGNVRELANVIERAMINSQGQVLVLSDKLEIAHENGSPSSRTISFEAMEREFILQRLEQTNWKVEGKDGAAQSLGLNSSTLRNRMNKLGIQRPKIGN